MPNITPTVSLNVENELQNLSLYKYHPNGILNVSLNRLTDMLDGKDSVDLKRAVFLMEWAVLDGYQMLVNGHRREMERLIAERSPEQIARMEAAIGKAVGEA